MSLSSQIKPISYLKAHASEIVRNIGKQQEPLIITQNGEAKAVVQDIKSYEQTQEAMALLKTQARSDKCIFSFMFRFTPPQQMTKNRLRNESFNSRQISD